MYKFISFFLLFTISSSKTLSTSLEELGSTESINTASTTLKPKDNETVNVLQKDLDDCNVSNLKLKLRSEAISKQLQRSEELLSSTIERLISNHKTESYRSKLTEMLQQKIDRFQKLSLYPTLCLPEIETSNTRLIKVLGGYPFLVLCDSSIAGQGWLVIQRRSQMEVSFNEDWASFKYGVGHLSDDFFLGLEFQHLLTFPRQHELYIYLKDIDNNSLYAHYSYFMVGKEKDYYKLLSIGEYSGNAGDGLRDSEGMMFSSSDRNNDNISMWKFRSSCAKQEKSGWWFNACGSSNLNGFKWNGKFYKEVQMMIRPVMET